MPHLSRLIISPAGHVIIPVHWNVGNESVIKAVVAVRCSEPLIKAMLQWQIMRQMTQMPEIASLSTILNNGDAENTQNKLLDFNAKNGNVTEAENYLYNFGLKHKQLYLSHRRHGKCFVNIVAIVASIGEKCQMHWLNFFNS